jgi:hypothetical protein
MYDTESIVKMLVNEGAELVEALVGASCCVLAPRRNNVTQERVFWSAVSERDEIVRVAWKELVHAGEGLHSFA